MNTAFHETIDKLNTAIHETVDRVNTACHETTCIDKVNTAFHETWSKFSFGKSIDKMNTAFDWNSSKLCISPKMVILDVFSMSSVIYYILSMYAQYAICVHVHNRPFDFVEVMSVFAN